VTGVDREDRIFRQDFTEFFEREVYLGQLLGEHYIPSLNDAEVKWRATYAQAGRDAPYERRVNYEDFEDGQGFRFQFNRPGTNNDIRFSTLDDETLDFGLDLVLPVDFGSRTAELKFGGAYLDKSRDSEQADFRYFGSIPVELRNSRIDLIFSDAVVDAGILEIRRGGTTGFPDVSEASLETFGAYPVTIKQGDLRTAVIDEPQDFYQVSKWAFGKKGSEKDKSTVVYNNHITMENIPLEAYDYVVNGKPALEWVMERQSVSIDKYNSAKNKGSGIVNNANDYANETMGNPAYPLELFQRVITVNLETMKIVRSLPKLDID